MKIPGSVAAFIAAFAVSATTHANQPVDPRLDYTANSLVFAANQLITSVRQAQGDSHIEQDAETLYDAAEHFKEEVELGPEDLDIDFQTISQTYDEMRAELSGCDLVRYNAQVRGSWFNVEESWVRLRQAWLAHGEPGPDPTPAPYPPPPVSPQTVTIDCASSRYQYQECPVAGQIVSAALTQVLSHASCAEGRSYGFRPGAVWVNRGCHGIFLVRTQG